MNKNSRKRRLFGLILSALIIAGTVLSPAASYVSAYNASDEPETVARSVGRAGEGETSADGASDVSNTVVPDAGQPADDTPDDDSTVTQDGGHPDNDATGGTGAAISGDMPEGESDTPEAGGCLTEDAGADAAEGSLTAADADTAPAEENSEGYTGAAASENNTEGYADTSPAEDNPEGYTGAAAAESSPAGETDALAAEGSQASGSNDLAALAADSIKADEADEDIASGQPALLSSGINENLSRLSAFIVRDATDGTEPFDADDEPGNDKDNKNGIVRTFDYVSYSLEYETQLLDDSRAVDEAYLMVSFILDCDPAMAEFNLDTLNWCEDLEVTYRYKDGTESTELYSDGTVISQTLTGRRHLINSSASSTVIPGTGTLSVGIYVKAASNGDTINPTFTAWMEGNSDDDQLSITDQTVTISAAPKYNICLTRNLTLNYMGYWDLDEGTVYGVSGDNRTYGRLLGYEIVVQLYNDNPDKGMKGMELPKGEISFDITVTSVKDYSDVTEDASYRPYLWDYEEASTPDINKTGKLGRWMAPGYIFNASYGNNIPANSGGGREACYDGGTVSIIQDDSQTNKWHVTIQDYSFDTEYFSFPTNAIADSDVDDPSYGANIGCFSSVYIEFLASFPDTVTEEEDLQFRVEVSSMKAASASGRTVEEEMNTQDNENEVNLPLYPEGRMMKTQWFYDRSYNSLHSHWSYGDAYAWRGAEITLTSRVSYHGDNCVVGFNLLQKFDDEGFEIPEGTQTLSDFVNSQKDTMTDISSVKVLFAAKPDKSGWASDEEMCAAREENLIFFDTIDELNAAGYTCVGYLYEIRGEIYEMSEGTDFYMPAIVRDTAEVNSVYMMTNDLRYWASGSVPSWYDVPYSACDGAYGLGDGDWEEGTYIAGYAKPDGTYYTNYVKTAYENGTIVSGHDGGYEAGNSLLVIGSVTAVDIHVTDVTDTTSGTTTKVVYDLDAGERIVNYEVNPSVSVASANREAGLSGEYTDVTLRADIPAGLTYIMNSASIAPSAIVEGDDGTVTLVWIFTDCPVGEPMEKITFACLIGAAGTPDDVENNDSLTIDARISSDEDSREYTSANGNYSEATITVIRLAATSIAKAVEKSILESGEDVVFILRYGDSTEEDVEGLRLFDVLPYPDDARGSSFSGAYIIQSIELDFSDAQGAWEDDQDSLSVWYTEDTAARESETAAAVMNGTDLLEWNQVTQGVKSGSILAFSDLHLQDVTALRFDIGTAHADDYLKITIVLSVTDESGELLPDESGMAQQAGDIYANTFSQYSDGQAAVVVSNYVDARVVLRTVSGAAWLDANEDGIRQEDEKMLSGVLASLYRTTPSEYDLLGEPVMTIDAAELYPAYDILGGLIESVYTDMDGSYLFEGLEEGTYCVVFTQLEEYTGVTIRNAGYDRSVDSDADAVMEGDVLICGWISGIVLPAIDEMYASVFQSEYNDIGLLTEAEEPESPTEPEDPVEPDLKEPEDPAELEDDVPDDPEITDEEQEPDRPSGSPDTKSHPQEPSPDVPDAVPTSPTSTGDESHVGIWCATVLFSVCVMAGAGKALKKLRHSRL